VLSRSANTTTSQFTVRRMVLTEPMHVNLTVTDACGGWSTFVGAGTSL